MKFAEIKGNAAACRALAGMVDSGRVPHAILFHEDDGGGGVALALAFLQYLYCKDKADGDSCGACAACNKISKLIHPDVHFIFPLVLSAGESVSEQYAKQWRELVISNPDFTETELYEALGFEGKNTVIGVKEANALLRKLSQYSLEGGYTSVLVYLPEKMNTTTANKLLKILEEPPQQTVFILVTHSPERLLPTISSRCQLVRVESSSPNDSLALRYDDGGLFASLMESLLDRNLSGALEVGEQLASLPSRDSAKAFCKFASEKMRRVFLVQQGLDSLAGDDPDAVSWAGRLRNTFPRKSLEAFDRSSALIGRNVNLKILFTDLVGRLYSII